MEFFLKGALRTISLKIRARKSNVIVIALLSVAALHSAVANANQELESIVAHVNNIQAGATDFAIPRIHQYSNNSSAVDIDNSTQPFIIGGTNAARGEYGEYTLVILTDGRGTVTGLCGGTLISSNTVLTAAHCSQSSASTYFTIPGFYTFSDPVTSGDLIQASTLRVHPNYASDTFDNDVAIITLSRASFLPAAKVFEGDSDLNGTLGTVIGTGLSATIPSEFAPNILQEVAAPIRSNTACNADWEQLIGIRPITQNMLCAGFTTDGRGSCSGDSGGPLYADFKGTRAVVGTVSFGLGACETNRGTQGYARMSALSDFIKSASPNTEFVRSNDTAFLPSIMMLLDEEPTPLPLPLTTNLIPPIAPFSQGKYVVRFNSQAGDIVGGGDHYRYTPTNSNIQIVVNNDESLSISLTGFGSSNILSDEQNWEWNMGLSLNTRLKKGHFRGAKNIFYSNIDNRLDVKQSSPYACDFSGGEFRILDIVVKGSVITKLVADFSQSCGSSIPKLTGSIYYDASNLEITPFYPSTNNEVLNPPANAPEFSGANVKIESGLTGSFGGPKSYSFSPENSYISVDTEVDNSIEFVVGDDETQWRFVFRPPNLDADPNNGLPFSTGVYHNARDYPYDIISARLVANRYFVPSCIFEQTGELRIFDITYKTNSNVPESFVGDLTIFCGEDRRPALTASINYNENLPEFKIRPESPPQLPTDFPELINAGTTLVFINENGDVRTFDPFNSNLEIEKFGGPNQGAGVVAKFQGQSWGVSFRKGALYAGGRLVPGIYPNAVSNTGNPISPHLSINVRDVNCRVLDDASFIIYDVVYDTDGKITKLLAEFEGTCHDTQGASRKGYVAFDSNLPAAKFPERELPSGEPTPALPDSGNSFKIVSSVGDPVGRGNTTVYDSTTARFVLVSGSNSDLVIIDVLPANGNVKWTISLEKDTFDIDPKRYAPMAPGVYTDVINGAFSSSPSAALEVSNIGSCSQANGLQDSSFRIFEIEYGADRKPIKLIADFVQQCGGSSAGLFGSIRYEAIPK